MTTKFTEFRNKLYNLETDKKVQLYILLFVIFLSLCTLIPNIALKIPCSTNNNDGDYNCSVLYEKNYVGLMNFNQSKYLGLYSMNIVTGCLCSILSFVLLIYVLK